MWKENVLIVEDTTHVTITWDAVAVATSYKIYSSDEPDTGQCAMQWLYKNWSI